MGRPHPSFVWKVIIWGEGDRDDGEMNLFKRYSRQPERRREFIFQPALKRTFTNIQPKVLYTSRFPRDISLNLGASLRN